MGLETAREEQVTCNAICPGYVLTDLIRNQLEDTARARGIPKARPQLSATPAHMCPQLLPSMCPRTLLLLLHYPCMEGGRFAACVWTQASEANSASPVQCCICADQERQLFQSMRMRARNPSPTRCNCAATVLMLPPTRYGCAVVKTLCCCRSG